jgi:hypothetical protein
MSKKKRVFFHYRKSTSGMTVHYNKQCLPCKNIICNIPTETHYNEKQQPHLVIRGFAQSVEYDKQLNTIIIS